MNKRQRKYFGKAAILAMVAASIPFTACSYLDSLLPHDPSDDDPIQISSSSKAKSSSSVATPAGEFQTWYGYNGEPQIQTGLANDTETAGYWYSFSDEMDGGLSKILWPVEPGNEYSNEAMDPILASSLKAVAGNAQIPAGYETGIHMFGTDAAFNLNSLYDWNNEAASVFVYFKTDNQAASPASTAGSNFTAGNLALSGVAGLGLGAALSAIVMGLNKKKKGKTDAA